MVFNGVMLKTSTVTTSKFAHKIFLDGSSLILFYLVFLLSTKCSSVVGTECMTRKYYAAVSYLEIIPINRTKACEMYFQWTVADFCCYDKYDRFDQHPACCYSETYKLVLAIIFICLILCVGTFTIFFCWVYNLPHHLLYIFTCGRFHLNTWLLKNKNGPYVDPSFYAGEPFWSRGAEMQPYPLRPMPPKIFYPAPPPKLKYRPQDRTNHHNASGVAQITSSGVHLGGGTSSESRRNSLSSNHGGMLGGGGTTNSDTGCHNQFVRRDSNSAPNGIFRRGSSALLHSGSRRESGVSGGYQKNSQNPPFKVNLDEGEATAELIEALKVINEGMEGSIPDSSLSQSNSPGEEYASQPTSSSTNKNDMEDEDDEEDGYDMRAIRPNTIGGSGLDQYGNYVSQPQSGKPNLRMLNQQLTNLRLPVYSMPGVQTAINTVQNYHVVSSNLGNPMETILEDDSLDDDYMDGGNSNNSKGANQRGTNDKEDMSVSGSNEKKNRSEQEQRSHPKERPQLKRRATSITSIETGRSSQRVLSAMDHLLVSTPTTRAIVPFTPTLPGSLSETDSSSQNGGDNMVTHQKRELRRNSVV